MPTHVHQNIGFFWNAAKMKLHVNRTCFHASLKSQTGLSSFRLPCERTLSFTLLEVMWTLTMKLPHSEVKFYPEVKCWSSCGSSLVSLEVFYQHKSCWSCRQLLYVTLFFISPLFIYFFNLEFQSLLSPVTFSALYLFHSILVYSSFYSLFCFLLLFIHFIFWSPLLFSFQICYPFFSLFLLLDSVCFPLALYYYSICSLSISLHLFRSPYLILLCYHFCSCFNFLYTSFFW